MRSVVAIDGCRESFGWSGEAVRVGLVAEDCVVGVVVVRLHSLHDGGVQGVLWMARIDGVLDVFGVHVRLTVREESLYGRSNHSTRSD